LTLVASGARPFVFSEAEMGRRRHALDGIMTAAQVRHVVLYGANRAGSSVPWITGWPVTREAHVLLSPGERPVLLVNFYNHVDDAIRRAPQAQVRWAGPDPVRTLCALLAERAPGPVGLIGALPFEQYLALSRERQVRDLAGGYVKLRLSKSDEEIAALRRAAALTDVAAVALVDSSSLGCTEHQLSARLEHAYVSRGGGHHIHYLAVTSMSDPDRCLPAQWPSERKLARGDILTFELSATSAPDYPGQLLRTFTAGADPTPLVADLHAVAQEAFEAIERRLRPGVLPAELIEAASVVEEAGFTTVDDLVHGFGGGYLPPVFGSAGRALGPVPDQPLESGMTVVVQPNVVTRDRRIGVQTGELLHITDSGSERLHTFPRGLGRIG